MNQRKFKRIIMHLEKLEELTGSKCRTVPRDYAGECPISNFAPKKDKNGFVFSHVYNYRIKYYKAEEGKIVEYTTHSENDSLWWAIITFDECVDYTKALSKYLREREK